tara:strand:- start:331 stop:615 length:285 start_codon:yes stop_codon:yes gene_type:complete
MIYKGLHSVTHDKTSTTFNCINVFKGDGENIDASFSITHSDHSVSPESIMRNIREWVEGKLVQDAFLYLCPNERELLITGMLPEDWENMDDLGE